MDLGDEDKFGLEKRHGDSMNYHSSNMTSEWQFGGANLTNQPIGLVPTDNSISVCKDDLIGSSACSSVSMRDSFCPSLWDHPNPQNLGFCDRNVQTCTNMDHAVAMRKGVPGSSRTGIDKALDISWNPSISKPGVFLQGGAGILPQSLSQFPTDSALIERAARFSCFSGGNFGDIVNPFDISESLSSYPKGGGTVRGAPENLSNGVNPGMGGQVQNNELNMFEVSKDVSLSIEHQAAEGSPNKNDRDTVSFVRPADEAKQGNGISSNESDEAEFSGGGVLEDPSKMESAGGEPSSSKGISSRKRKSSGQNTELDQVKGPKQLHGEAEKERTDTEQKGDQIPASTSTKPSGKHGKDGSEAADGPKEDYIHIRARRGQATNSHSLAERVRREKISERMKFLQDLVPGCSKVTGKAVMLDEIINYVQSLQRQVEFLSMKLAAVNPRLDFSMEGLLAKDILKSQGPTMGVSPDLNMFHPHLHPSQQGLIQSGIPGMRNPSDALRRTINSQLTAMNGAYKEHAPQLNNAWDDELHNVLQMCFGTSAPFNGQDLNSKNSF